MRAQARQRRAAQVPACRSAHDRCRPPAARRRGRPVRARARHARPASSTGPPAPTALVTDPVPGQPSDSDPEVKGGWRRRPRHGRPLHERTGPGSSGLALLHHDGNPITVPSDATTTITARARDSLGNPALLCPGHLRRGPGRGVQPRRALRRRHPLPRRSATAATTSTTTTSRSTTTRWPTTSTARRRRSPPTRPEPLGVQPRLPGPDRLLASTVDGRPATLSPASGTRS